ncbi:unnamed protein product, partial [marine sediment metagenome]
MSIKSPATYGDYYWAMQVEAQAAFDEQIEDSFAGYFGSFLADIPDISELPVGFQTLIKTLSEPPAAGFGGFALGVGVESVDEILHTAMQPMMKMVTRKLNTKSRETWLNSEQANTLF